MSYKIVSDSSSDLLAMEDMAYASVPLKIITSEKEYVDSAELDVSGMIEDLKKYKGESKSSCPNSQEWQEAFENYEHIFCVTITSGLSGSYNAARLAVDEYMQKNPGKQGHVIDTLSVGPEAVLIMEKLKELIAQKLDFKEIINKINEYKSKTHLIFALESLRNLANNGRVSHAVAKLAGVLGIRIIGKASNQGTLEITNKSRGSERALTDIVKNMIKTGYEGGIARIHHCRNFKAAEKLKEMIMREFPGAMIKIQETRALCSFYAEDGGLLVGFEGGVK
ncbi:MAG: DegV family EDD domain-containing protein [Clostridiales bacterium]|nr:DegV family EDD domain-containing protein [Clostridiales bacterium]